MSASVTKNKKVYFDYFVEEEYEAGIALVGSEIKSIREGQINIRESFVTISEQSREAFLLNCYIKEYPQANRQNHPDRRSRKLLLHKKEIVKMYSKLKAKGYTVKPLEVYFKGHLVKIKLGLCRGKKLYDKREAIKKREANIKMDRIVKSINNRA